MTWLIVIWLLVAQINTHSAKAIMVVISRLLKTVLGAAILGTG